MNSIVLKWALKNAYDFGGKANSKAVLGMVLKEKEELRKKIPEVMKEIEKAAGEVERLEMREIKERLKKIAPELLAKKEEKKRVAGELKELPEAKKGKTVLRIAPSPSGPLHIGHAYGAAINYKYAKMYGGKLILRIEDTNPENIYEPAYKLIEDDLNWLTEKGVSRVVVQSSRLRSYYKHAEKLISLGKAYVCDCDADKWRELKAKGEACRCRKLSARENQLRYAKMFNEYSEGEAVLRLKTDIKDKNPALRDFGLLRVVEHVHPKLGKKARVWPLMVFAVAIDDHELGITHVLHGKDHVDNAKKEQIIMKYLGWKPPAYGHWGRINFEGMKLSTTQTRLAIERGEYTGWDDIRLATLLALKRRGYQAEALRKFALEIGLTLTDKTVSREEFFKIINAFNKEIVEKKANRYFFIDEPREAVIIGTPKRKVKIGLHPDFPKRGQRGFTLGKEFYLAKSDLELLEEGKLHRLMDCFNFEVKKGRFRYVSDAYDEYKNSGRKGMIIHWLPAEETQKEQSSLVSQKSSISRKLKVEVVMEDGSVMEGIGESGMEKLKTGALVQLERRFFARLDRKEGDKLVFWFLHK